MKFGESLSEGLVPEWKEQYVDYKAGKKRIKSIGLLAEQVSPHNAVETTPLLLPQDGDVSYTPLDVGHGAMEGNSNPSNSAGITPESALKDSRKGGIDEGGNPGHSVNVLPENQLKPPPKDLAKVSSKTSIRGSMKSLMRQFSGKTPSESFREEKKEFMKWLDDELRMVDEFYKEQEKGVYARFLILEDQFFQLKEHRSAHARISSDVAEAERTKKILDPVNVTFSRWKLYLQNVLEPLSKYDTPSLPSMAFLDCFKKTSKKQDEVKLESKVGAEGGYDVHFRENQIRNGQLTLDGPDDDLFSLNSVSHSSGSVNALHKRKLNRSDTQDDQSLHAGSSQDLQIFDGARQNLNTSASHDPVLEAKGRRRDYVAKKRFGVPYYYARKQLKDALIEHYRSLALVRSYRTMNRTALRKITKKFDKATGASISGDFMKRVDKEAYFQTSETLDQVLTRVEDLFLSFFEHDAADRKNGLDKLRSATYAYTNADLRAHSFYKATFLSGLFLGAALPFFGIGLYLALKHTLSGQLPEGRFLLQVWAGFFLILLALFLVGINYVVYTAYKINYKFIFEFNLASALDYKQFFLLPSLGLGLLCSFAWLSFADFWPNTLPGRVWPLIYLACALLVFLWPGNQLYLSSRRWMQVAIWRIVCSGLYPVEFRDFYIGDILCSLTYSIGNLSFFICLYADKWRHVLGGGPVPPSSAMCGSSHSRLMGFLATLPSIWRFLQCVRRYMDSGDAFPHLANMLKYLVGVIYYCLLSVWRIQPSHRARALFITFACINLIFTSIWDIVMDWSLGLVSSKNFLLRDHLFYESPLVYYAAIVVDVVLRFQWIFYAFFSEQIQQSAVTSFCIALAEILRRFMWMFFRMENEHCTNVVMFRASRESRLPYMISSKVERAINKLVDLRYNAEKVSDDELAGETTAHKHPRGTSSSYRASAMKRAGDEETGVGAAPEPARNMSRRRSTIVTITNALNKAHIKDFQRKKVAVHHDDSEEELDELDEQSESEAPDS